MTEYYRTIEVIMFISVDLQSKNKILFSSIDINA